MQSITELPLHGGRAPRWLFGRMVRLGSAISDVILDEFGAGELLARLCDPDWLQALSCAIGYDWHSSGTTTVTMGAMKEALKESGEICIAGGKGRAGIRTPKDIEDGANKMSVGGAERFVELSRMAAKVDSALVYDDAPVYHHSFIFTRKGRWGVVQQAMHSTERKAIRFQILDRTFNEKDFASEPNASVSSAYRARSLDLTYSANSTARTDSVNVLKDNEYRRYPYRHEIIRKLDISDRAWKSIEKAAELDPKDYNELLMARGVGRATLRSIAILSSLIYGNDLAYRDPVAYSYNLGGKDGIPFRVNRRVYDDVTESMKEIVNNARIGKSDRYKALRRLGNSITA